ncbi:MAG: transglutaminase [Rhizobiales bacterium 24-66-13]|jgi:transglutaminase-like putative cysteine protease|uniref:transglutaminase family protein n=1 Tax=Roseixanthobacter finlandensis TaxID=3119922 RepID=UPI000BD6618E|nr:MAG: transglutaminase [Rhizobiales bacterium 35-66-30]OYZ81745.1 MAG: transglutaminase [Rhizobiales bacterium 24-66-13]HQS09893.1 transglutaminase family protein [Xanthobacteraceae bacterium]
MARISIVHTTEYTYRNPVGLTRHRMMLRPDDSHDLRLHSATLKVEPEPASIRWAHDVFNNSICFLEWPQDLRTERLSIVSTLDLTHHPEGPPLPVYSLEPAAELFPFSYAASEIADVARLAERQQPDPNNIVDQWARRFLGDGGKGRTLEVMEAITHAIKAEFRYGARHEAGTQTAAETLTLRSGTCRDFAVLMMEALRSFGLAARFVTGYLYPDSFGETVGGGSTHAWCSVYLPGAGWVEYDPTNGLVAGANLIRVGVTRASEQAIPISGGFIGDASDPLAMHVDVAVRAVAAT